MFKSQVIPYGNLVLVERTHLVSKVDMRGTKDVLIPAPIEQKVIAIGETVTKPISVGDIVYCNPNPFFGIIMNFDDNDYEFDKVRKQIADEDKKAMNPILVPSTSRGVAKKLPDFNDKVTIVTHMMMMETDVLCKVKPVEYTFMASPESPVTLKN
jgi:hypothetical protein